MPRYYCDYCDTYLTHDSPSVRKQHNAGYKHKANVRTYYQQFEEQQTQSLIDQRIKEHLGQAAAFQSQVGATFNPHLMQGPRLPMIRPPVLPVGASAQAPIGSPLLAGVRPPVLPRPVAGPQGYMGMPSIPPTMAPPGASSMPMQMNALPRPPPLAPPATGSISTPTSNGPAPLVNPITYQANPSSAPSAPAAPTMSQDGFSYAQASEISR